MDFPKSLYFHVKLNFSSMVPAVVSQSSIKKDFLNVYRIIRNFLHYLLQRFKSYH